MRPALLSKLSSTDARPTGLRSPAPLKITSCIDSPRSAEALDSPSTQRSASITFDLPQPLGPTTPTICPGNGMCVGSTNDLKPASLIWDKRNLTGQLNIKKLAKRDFITLARLRERAGRGKRLCREQLDD